MRRYGDLFARIVTRENLAVAFWKASRGKRHRPSVRGFARDLDQRLAELGQQLRDGTFSFGRYFQFTIFDPKERLISAPRFAERVAHHAIFNVCEPVFERLAIADTFACIRDRGQQRAIGRAQELSRRYGWFLKLDVRKYFDSVDHERLLDRLAGKFKEEPLLKLFGQIVHGYATEPGRGLPIGALTSQHFANYYLGACDRFVQQELRLPGYVRYMDDMIVWSNDRPSLRGFASALREFLAESLRLELKPAYINRTRHGVSFLGLRVFPDALRLGCRGVRDARRRYRSYLDAWAVGELSEWELQQRLACLVAWLRTADTMSFRQRLFAGEGAEPTTPARLSRR